MMKALKWLLMVLVILHLVSIRMKATVSPKMMMMRRVMVINHSVILLLWVGTTLFPILMVVSMLINWAPFHHLNNLILIVIVILLVVIIVLLLVVIIVILLVVIIVILLVVIIVILLVVIIVILLTLIVPRVANKFYSYYRKINIK